MALCSFPEVEKFDNLPEPSVDGPSAFVSIMEGCSKYCTFCVVPYTRGEEVSRPVQPVLQEIYYELVLGWSYYIHEARKLDLEAVDLTVVLEKANLHAVLIEDVS